MPETGAKRKLLDAAEALVTEKGFDLVSVRDITGAVKANVAAVNYHFGSREGLMDLVMMRILEPLCDHRVKALEQAKKKGKDSRDVIREILSGYVESLTTAAASIGMENASFLRLAGRILVLPDSCMAPSLAFSRREVGEKFLDALAGALPDNSRKELSAAWNFFEAGVAQSLLADKPETEDWISIGIRCLAGGEGAARSESKGAQGLLFDF
ncbi:MAG: TetR family transcriptional regulator [Luteolibacter sp.]